MKKEDEKKNSKIEETCDNCKFRSICDNVNTVDREAECGEWKPIQKIECMNHCGFKSEDLTILFKHEIQCGCHFDKTIVRDTIKKLK